MTEKIAKPQLRFAGFDDTWEQRKLGDVLSLLKDGTHGTHKDSDEGVFLLSAKNIKNGKVFIDENTNTNTSGSVNTTGNSTTSSSSSNTSSSSSASNDIMSYAN